MRFLRAVSGFVLFVELPIPIYWLILHPFHSFWKTRVRAAFWFAGLTAWTCGGVALWSSRRLLLAAARPSWFAIAAGFALIAVEVYLLVRVERELGSRRLVGHAELTGTGEMYSGGLYAYVRHPRYAGMFGAVIGAALLAGTPLLGLVLVLWWPFALLVIRLEEKELAVRFGPNYEAYRKRVPAFLPFRLIPRKSSDIDGHDARNS
jgi:protein-S-isoprenylcysteine O-methyltransferase Ste14